ncbi:cupin domain-containing protein [Chloroflexota bacterium]
MFINTGNLPQKELAEGVTTNVAWGERLMLSFVKLNPNATVPPHRHPHEQMALVLSGKLEVTIADESRLLKEGDAFLVPSDVEHGAKNLESQTRVLDIFSPPREDLK